MAKRISSGLAWALLGLGVASSAAPGQVVEREQDTTITGPRGRTIERDIKVKRGPGFVDRQVEIKRPGETIVRDTRIQAMPGGVRPFGPPPGFGGPRFYGGPRIVENVIVQRPPVVSAFVGVPALSFFFGGNPAPPPPPVVVAPPAQAPQAPPQFDAFTDAVGRLKSFHAHSRRDGALTLGRMGDPRAVPALNERLEHDFDKEVRVASAWALGEIGDERGAVALERAALHDRKPEVKEAANLAYQKLPKPGQAANAPRPVPPPVPPQAQYPPQAPAVIQSRPDEVLDPGPTPSTTTSPAPTTRPVPSELPPPPPVPAGEPPLEAPSNSRPAGSRY